SITQSINFSLERAIIVFRLGGLLLELEDLAAHPLVLLNDRKVPERHPESAGDAEKEHDKSRELAPNSEIDVHLSELNTTFRWPTSTFVEALTAWGPKAKPSDPAVPANAQLAIFVPTVSVRFVQSPGWFSSDQRFG